MHFNDDEEIGWFVEGDEWEPPKLETQQAIYRRISQDAYCFAIGVEGRPVGECWLQRMNLPRLAERFPGLDLRRIDLLIREKSVWGRGLGSRAIRLLTEFGFGQVRAEAIFGCDIWDFNGRSLGAFRRAGFEEFERRPPPPGGKGSETIDVVRWRDQSPRHPLHHEIEATMASWYRGPSAEFTVELRGLGWCRRPIPRAASATPDVTVRDVPLERLDAAIADAGDWLGTDDFRLVLDDRDLDSRLGTRLLKLGWERRGVTVYLCHVGVRPPDHEDVVRRQVGSDDEALADWVRLRSQAFADTSWVRPTADDLATEIRQRRLQEADGAVMFAVDRAEAPAGIVAWHKGPDRFVFNLAVLPSQRSHGVGAEVMAREIGGAERSVLVNTDEDDGPVDLYGRWGFTDEVYRRITCRRGQG